jgi:hypothetical protein
MNIQSNDVKNNDLRENTFNKVLSPKEGEPKGVYVDHPRPNIIPFIRYFYVPKNLCLEDFLKAKGYHQWLTAVRLCKLYRWISFIQYTYANSGQSGVKRNGFVTICSTTLRKILGKRIINGRAFYKLATDVLVDIGVLEVNERYAASDAQRQGFPKSFRLARAYWNQPIKVISLREKTPGPLKDESRILNDIQYFVHSNIRQLKIDEEALGNLLQNGSLSAERTILVRESAEVLKRGAINLRGGAKQRRVYHCVSRSPREMRSFFHFKDRRLIEYDIPTCQAVLLLALADGVPATELEAYKATLRSDIYTELTTHGDRERAKKEFLRFAFGAYRKKNEFGETFQQRFPALSKRIRQFGAEPNDMTLSCYLQDLEAEICIYTVVKRCMEQGVFVVPVHDSFIIKPESFEIVNSIVRAEFERRFNFPVELKPRWRQTHSELLAAA